MKTKFYTKLIIFSLLGFSMLFLFNACKKYLDVPPQGVVSEDDIKTDPQAAVDLVTGVYNVLWLGDFGPDIHGVNFVMMTNVASDDADKGSTPSDYPAGVDIDALNPNAANGAADGIWEGYFQGVSRTNQALDKLPLSPLDAKTKASLEGEVRFLRAYFYFNLVRFFGGVPKIDHLLTAAEANESQFQVRASRDTIYNFIISDLQFAVANLPAKGSTPAGRATLGAAQSLLAKVYMYQNPADPGNMQKALDLTNSVINSGAYSLVKDYSLIWREAAVNGDGGDNNSESIFEVQTGVNADCSAAIGLYSDSQGPRAGGAGGWADLGFGFGNPTKSLINSYEPGDLRKAATVIFIDSSAAHVGTTLWDGFRIPSQDSVQNSTYSYKAYHSRTREQYCGNNDRLPKDLIILRLADVLLINAEAANALGNTGQAISDLNLIRARAGLAPIISSPDLRATIWHERRIEMAMEHDRFFDLVRQDAIVPGTAAAAFAADGGKAYTSKNSIFPIPQPQIDLSNGNLTQNPGY